MQYQSQAILKSVGSQCHYPKSQSSAQVCPGNSLLGVPLAVRQNAEIPKEHCSLFPVLCPHGEEDGEGTAPNPATPHSFQQQLRRKRHNSATLQEELTREASDRLKKLLLKEKDVSKIKKIKKNQKTPQKTPQPNSIGYDFFFF